MSKLVRNLINEPIGYVPVVSLNNIEDSGHVSRWTQKSSYLPISMHEFKYCMVEVMPTRADAQCLLEYYLEKYKMQGFGGIQALSLHECFGYVAHGAIALPDPMAIEIRQIFREIHVLPKASCHEYSWKRTRLAKINYRRFSLTNSVDKCTVHDFAMYLYEARKK